MSIEMLKAIKTKIKPNNLILSIVLLLSILPTIKMGSFGMPVLYLLLPIGMLVLFLIISGRVKIPAILKYITLIICLIIIENFISAIIGTITYFNKFIFPTDVIQYIARFLFLASFTVVFYEGKIEADTFIKYFLIFLNIGMLIGILQWIPWIGREFFIKLYPFRDGSKQLSQLNRPLYALRLHGMAQHATANGGLATFFSIFGYSVFKYYKKHKFLSVSLMILCIINIFASQARAGMLALVFSVFLFYIVSIYINKKILKSTVHMIIVVLMAILVGWALYNNGNHFVNRMVYRWRVLFDTQGGGRIDQANYFFSLFNKSYQYLFGISKAVVNQSDIPYGVEIEPVNIFITYGAIGFILQYSLVFMLLIYFFKNIRKSIDDKISLTLLVASFVGLFSYQIFSVAYFFFREIRVGLFPWIVMGVTIGVYERYKLNKLVVKSNKL